MTDEPGETMPREDMSRGGSGRAEVNKNFLLNTVHGLKSHNKREEEEDCWRQHSLEQKARERQLAHDTNRNRGKDLAEEAGTSASHASDVDARRFWAEQKERAMTAITPAIDPSAAATGQGSSPLSVDRKRKREHSEEGIGRANGDRRDRRRKEEKKKTKKKKEKKRKRENRDRGGSDDERGAVGVGTGGGDEKARRQKRSKRAEKKRKK